MLNLYYHRADRQPDWQELLSKRAEHTIFIVPDQATLQTERMIIESLGVPGLIDIEAIGFSRLGNRILSECGGITRRYIDNRGRDMLLAKIISECKEQLQIFGRAAARAGFPAMVSKLIAEFKQFQTRPADLASMVEDTNSILYKKLDDIQLIFSCYEEQIKGKYIDTEDQIGLYTSKIKESGLIRKTEIWIHGFDYYTPKTLSIIEQLMLYAISVNVLLTFDQDDPKAFPVGESSMYKLQQIAARNGVPFGRYETGKTRDIPTDLTHIEKSFFLYPPTDYRDKPKHIKLVQCSDCYTEAETAAAEIIRLVRDENMRFKDIAIICNDTEVRGRILKRTLAEHEIPCFIDQKRNIMHSKFAGFVIALIATVIRNYRYEDVFQLIKTGLIMEDSKAEQLENYALQYKILGKKWRSEFTYGKKDKYGKDSPEKENALKELNQMRVCFMNFMGEFEQAIKPCDSVHKKSEMLYFFLRDYVKIPEKIEALTMDLREKRQFEYAMETAQVWNVIVSTLDQAASLIGDLDVTWDVYLDMLITGFEAVEVGIIPSVLDQVIVGTLQRTRLGDIKALLAVGVNDGLMPGKANNTELLSEREKATLLAKKEDLFKHDHLREEEEQLSIYRMLTSPSRRLYLSFSATDIDGREAHQSILIDRLIDLLPVIEIEKDVISGDCTADFTFTGNGFLRYVAENLRKGLDGEQVSEEVKAAYNWYAVDPAFKNKISALKRGLLYEKKEERLTKQQVTDLFTKVRLPSQNVSGTDALLILSPSQLEHFSRCPFAHLMRYGIKPEERRIFHVAAPELGEIFHEALLRFSKEAASGSWEEMTDGKKAEARMDRIVTDLVKVYKEGVLTDAHNDAYRIERIKRVCRRTAKAVAVQICRGYQSFNKFYFETSFGRSGVFSALEQTAANGGNVLIEGRIDRVDVFRKDENLYVKVIDYKSGSDYFDIKEAEEGWKLQLMLYLRAAMKGIAQINPRCEITPAGVFYLKISDPSVMTDTREKMEEEIQKQFKMDGLILKDENVIFGIDPEISRYSDIIPVAFKTKEGFESTSKSKKQLLSKEEFNELLDKTENLTKDLCGEILKGNIDICPKKLDNSKGDACTYCPYLLICGYERRHL